MKVLNSFIFAVKAKITKSGRMICRVAAEEPLHIGGCLRYGDNVEDEWIALSLLFDLTRSYSNTIARAWDCDGEVRCRLYLFSTIHGLSDIFFVWSTRIRYC
jgi:hypothetical protein